MITETPARRVRVNWALLAIVLASLAVRTAFISLPRMARWDEASYLTIASNLLAGRGYSELMGMPDVHQPPMVSLLATAGLALHLPLDKAAAMPAQALLGGLVVLPLYALGRAVYDRRAGLLAALLGALYPALAVSPLYWGSLTEPPYMLFVLTGLYAAYRCGLGISGAARPWGWAALMGLAFGLGYLSRPESLLFLGVMGLYLGLVWLFSGSERWRGLGRLAAAGAVAAAVLALTALPYLLTLREATGHWVLSGKAGTSMDIAWAFANHSQALHDQAAASLDSTGQETLWLSPEAFDRSISGWIAADPQRFMTLVRRNMADTADTLFGQDLFQPWLTLLAILAWPASPGRANGCGARSCCCWRWRRWPACGWCSSSLASWWSIWPSAWCGPGPGWRSSPAGPPAPWPRRWPRRWQVGAVGWPARRRRCPWRWPWP
jgi:4-amino-4-deoxy-L-arabinose transferase-like glycosyltransferase